MFEKSFFVCFVKQRYSIGESYFIKVSGRYIYYIKKLLTFNKPKLAASNACMKVNLWHLRQNNCDPFKGSTLTRPHYARQAKCDQTYKFCQNLRN